MNDKQKLNIISAALEMKNSLDQSIRDAGGTPEAVYNKDTTVYELITSLCTNSIEFVYIGPKKPDNKYAGRQMG